jgi:hypothetical protein
MQYWTAVDLLNQLYGTLGLTKKQTVVDEDPQNTQMIGVLNEAGNELNTYYPWEQFEKELVFQLVADQEAYDLPADWKYFIDQTQWDRTNHWPLLGPKSPAEWAWLKNGLIASFPRMRYRVRNNKFQVFPKPASNSEFTFAMEYVSGAWVQNTDATTQEPNASMVKFDGDIIWYDPWLMIKYTKLKWLQLKGFDTTAAQADFLRIYEALRGKDTGAQVLSLVPQQTPFFIGPWSVPDGNWNI